MQSNEKRVLNALRGATTCEANTPECIEFAVIQLINELIDRNKLLPNQIISIVFSVTNDLDACFPASIARKKIGFNNVALLDCQQMYVKNDLKRCIRILAHVWLMPEQTAKHPYLEGASKLRPDR